LLHQVGDLFELNVKLRCQKVKSVDACSNSLPPTDIGKATALLYLHSPKCHSLRCA